MGPQLQRCGRGDNGCDAFAAFPGFNGAATSALRKEASPLPAGDEAGGFNGAATSALRKGVIPDWGGRRQNGFNGAATSALRKGADPAASSAQGRSFNGAATSALRKAPVMASSEAGKASLQWGRNFSVAEGRAASRDGEGKRVASMGPQLQRCGRPRAKCPS